MSYQSKRLSAHEAHRLELEQADTDAGALLRGEITVQDFNARSREKRRVNGPRFTNLSARLDGATKMKGGKHGRAAAPVKSSQSSPTMFTQADIDRAVARGVSRERARVAAVFAADASCGRERICAKLLTAPNGWSASAIVAELPNLGTDRSSGRQGAASNHVLRGSAVVQTSKKAASSRADAGALWDQVIGERAAQNRQSSADSDDLWDRAIAQISSY